LILVDKVDRVDRVDRVDKVERVDKLTRLVQMDAGCVFKLSSCGLTCKLN